MSKSYFLIAGAIIAGACAAAGLVAMQYTDKRKDLIDELLDLRDDLELDCDIINSATSDSPKEITTPEDKKYNEIVQEGIRFTNATFPLRQKITELIPKLSNHHLEAFIDSFKTSIAHAESAIMAIDVAREDMQASHA